jgi:hypothetical protein
VHPLLGRDWGRSITLRSFRSRLRASDRQMSQLLRSCPAHWQATRIPTVVAITYE